jgi:hypothetical protein
MFETSAPPEAWTKPLNQCRRLMMPCKQNKEAFEGRGVTTPIDVVPLGVNPDNWPATDRSGRDGKFTFLMSAGLTFRKNPVGAAEAFVAAFPNSEEVRLILKTRGAVASSGFRYWRKFLPNDERIYVISEESTPKQMLDWMRQADAFVFPSKGEGFGLTPLQAMCTGLPTIVSDNSGMSEYANPKYNYPIPCREIPVPDHAHGGFPPDWGDVGNWWEPDFDCLVETMREVYRRHDEARAKGMAAARWVRGTWTIEQTCNRILLSIMKDYQED